MTGPVYYLILIALVSALVTVLVLLIRKRRRNEEIIRAYQEQMDKLRAERRAEEERKKTHYSTYNEAEQQATKWRHGRTYIDEETNIPKYAAGDDMDRLRREYQQESYGPIIMAGLALMCALGIFLYSSSRAPATPGKVFNGPQNSDKLAMQIVSTETNQTGTKAYVTLHYENLTAVLCYEIETTVDLICDGRVVDTVELTIPSIPGTAQTEEIVTLDIPEAYQGTNYKVQAKVNYKHK